MWEQSDFCECLLITKHPQAYSPGLTVDQLETSAAQASPGDVADVDIAAQERQLKARSKLLEA